MPGRTFGPASPESSGCARAPLRRARRAPHPSANHGSLFGESYRFKRGAEVRVGVGHELRGAVGIGPDDTEAAARHEVLVVLRVIDALERAGERLLHVGRNALR